MSEQECSPRQPCSSRRCPSRPGPEGQQKYPLGKRGTQPLATPGCPRPGQHAHAQAAESINCVGGASRPEAGGRPRGQRPRVQPCPARAPLWCHFPPVPLLQHPGGAILPARPLRAQQTWGRPCPASLGRLHSSGMMAQCPPRAQTHRWRSWLAGHGTHNGAPTQMGTLRAGM